MKTGPKPLPIAQRFWPKVRKTDSCWMWIGGGNHAGYGSFSISRSAKPQRRGAHVVSWFLHTGNFPPSGLFVLHHCDNPSCVRPDHLFVGTHHDNMFDMRQKGRQLRGDARRATMNIQRGSKTRSAVLNEAQVSAILRDYIGAQDQKYGATRRLAKQYRVSEATIYMIVKRKTWKHVVPELASPALPIA